MGDLQRLLKETSADIKVHIAAELKKQIKALKDDLEALTSHTSLAEYHITGLTQRRAVRILHR
ncbi:Hypothetical predicted protein [Pelobates cultripes]|uniref:Uncharacterized protein n=1 Tax=Pelobates cultripes TaxID=61616 RepID=A0AAD1VJ82_PELCU|nr:Hypothetical predicted protein [Pelobates cultripes]